MIARISGQSFKDSVLASNVRYRRLYGKEDRIQTFIQGLKPEVRNQVRPAVMLEYLV